MVANDPLHIYEVRIASFAKIHSRRRVSSANAKNPPAPLRWPHERPTPQALAKAGFSFTPTVSSPDNTSCYLCKKDLANWEEDDVPAIEHTKHSGFCGWALVHATELKLEGNPKAPIDDPMGETMIEARKMTFGNWWPHEKKKGWLPKIDKCAEAGFHYAPTIESDDNLLCVYCGLALDGWEADDDPIVEHRRRNASCRFFTWKPRQPRASAVARPRSASVESRLESQVDSDHSVAESVITGKKPGRGRAAGTTKKKRAGRGKESDLESFAGSPEPAPTRRGKKRNSSVLASERVELFDESDLAGHPLAQPPAARGRKPKRPRASNATAIAADEDHKMQYDSDASVAQRSNTAVPRRKKGSQALNARGKTYGDLRIPDDDEIDRRLALDLEQTPSEEEIDTSKYIKPFVKTPNRRLTRSRMPIQQGLIPQMPSLNSNIPKSIKKLAASTRGPHKDVERLAMQISIPKHLAPSDSESSKPQEKPAKARGKGRPPKTAQPPPSPPAPTQEVEAPVLEDKQVKKRGRPKKESIAIPIQAQPIRRVEPPEPEKTPLLRNIRKSIDGGMVLFDGGADSDDAGSSYASPMPPPRAPSPMEPVVPKILPKKKTSTKIGAGRGRKPKSQEESQDYEDSYSLTDAPIASQPDEQVAPAPLTKAQRPTSKKVSLPDGRVSNTSFATAHEIEQEEQEHAAPKPRRSKPSGGPTMNDGLYPALPPGVDPFVTSKPVVETASRRSSANPRTSWSSSSQAIKQAASQLGSFEDAVSKSSHRPSSLVMDAIRAPSIGKAVVEEYEVFRTDDVDHHMQDSPDYDPADNQLVRDANESIVRSAERLKEQQLARTRNSFVVEDKYGEAAEEEEEYSEYLDDRNSLITRNENSIPTTQFYGTDTENEHEEMSDSENNGRRKRKPNSPKKSSQAKRVSTTRKDIPGKKVNTQSPALAKPATSRGNGNNRVKVTTVGQSSAKKGAAAQGNLKPKRKSDTLPTLPPPASPQRFKKTLVISPRPERHALPAEAQQQQQQAPPPAMLEPSFSTTEMDTIHDEDYVERDTDVEATFDDAMHEQDVVEEEEEEEIEEVAEIEDEDVEIEDAQAEEAQEDGEEEDEEDREEEEEIEEEEEEYEEEGDEDVSPDSDAPSVLTPSKVRTQLPLSPAKRLLNNHHLHEDTSSPTPTALISTDPWTPIDVDMLVPFPEDDDDEAGGVDGADLLTAEESEMTVQEWVMWNAEMAEQNFKDRCEEVIQRFMEEGRRAIRAIEGIRTID